MHQNRQTQLTGGKWENGLEHMTHLCLNIILACIASVWLFSGKKCCVGLATPIRTGAIRDSAISHNSGIDWWMRALKTRLQRSTGSDLYKC